MPWRWTSAVLAAADKPAAGYSLAGFAAADAVAFMDAVGVSAAVLVGSSSGGYVAQQVAVTSPHRVAGPDRRAAGAAPEVPFR